MGIFLFFCSFSFRLINYVFSKQDNALLAHIIQCSWISLNYFTKHWYSAAHKRNAGWRQTYLCNSRFQILVVLWRYVDIIKRTRERKRQREKERLRLPVSTTENAKCHIKTDRLSVLKHNICVRRVRRVIIEMQRLQLLVFKQISGDFFVYIWNVEHLECLTENND